MLGGIGVVVVIILVVVALLLAGLIPGFHLGGSSTSSSGLTTEQSASSTATSFANGITGAPWSLKFASGMDSTTGWTNNVSTYSNSSCPLHGSTISKVNYPSYTGSYSTGLAHVWLFVFTSTGGAQLILVVQNGSAVEAGQTIGPGCVPGGLATLTGSLVDSSAAAQAAVATPNGSKYVSEVAESNASYFLEHALIGTLASTVPVWLIYFNGCSGRNSSSYGAEVYATNGTVLSSRYFAGAPSSSCGKLLPPIGSALALGNAHGMSCPTGSGVLPGDTGGCTAGDWSYTVTVESSTVALDDFELKVAGPTGAAFTATGSASFTVLNVTGDVIASYVVGAGSFSMTSTWHTYSTGESDASPLTATDTVIVDMGQTSPTTGQNLALVEIGVTAYSGTASVGIP